MPKICPKCGSDMEPYLSVAAFKITGFFGRPKLVGYVCASCRYVEFWQEGK